MCEECTAVGPDAISENAADAYWDGEAFGMVTHRHLRGWPLRLAAIRCGLRQALPYLAETTVALADLVATRPPARASTEVGELPTVSHPALIEAELGNDFLRWRLALADEPNRLPGPSPVPGPDRHDGLFVVFEGGEGGGKTTQARLLHEALVAQGSSCWLTREPGGTALGRKIRKLVLDPGPPIPATAEALLYLADRAVHVAEVIRPALERREIVISDRFADSTSVYQGFARNLGMWYLAELSRWAVGNLEPDLVFVLDVDPEVGLARAAARGEADRIERETLNFHRKVRAGFVQLAAIRNSTLPPTGRDGGRYVMVDAARPVGVVAEEILATVQARLVARGMA